MESEEFHEQLLQLLEAMCSDSKNLPEFIGFFENLKKESKEANEDYEDYVGNLLFDTICEEAAEFINDSQFGIDEIGPNAVSDADVLRAIYENICSIDENVEVVLATNPNTPVDILDKLTDSTFSWEEDGTTDALARNTSNINILTKLSRNEEGSTRYSVAANIATPHEVLANLAKDEGTSDHEATMTRYDNTEPAFLYIKFAVLNNSNCPKTLIQDFADGKLGIAGDDNYSKKVNSYLHKYANEKLLK